MRKLITGLIGVTWGGVLLASWTLKGCPIGTDAYGMGQNAGVLFATILTICGVNNLCKASKDGA
jgi:hypothetical protein